MGDRGEEGRAQALGLGQHPALIDPLSELDALDRDRDLVEKGVEQAAVVGAEERPGLRAGDAEHADGAAAGAHRQEKPLGAGQGRGVAPGGLVVLPGPACGGEIGLVELVLGWPGCLHRQTVAIVIGEEDHRLDPEHGGDLVDRGPEQLVEVGEACELAAEGVELGRGPGLDGGLPPSGSGRGRRGCW